MSTVSKKKDIPEKQVFLLERVFQMEELHGTRSLYASWKDTLDHVNGFFACPCYLPYSPHSKESNKLLRNRGMLQLGNRVF